MAWVCPWGQEPCAHTTNFFSALKKAFDPGWRGWASANCHLVNKWLCCFASQQKPPFGVTFRPEEKPTCLNISLFPFNCICVDSFNTPATSHLHPCKAIYCNLCEKCLKGKYLQRPSPLTLPADYYLGLGSSAAASWVSPKHRTTICWLLLLSLSEGGVGDLTHTLICLFLVE